MYNIIELYYEWKKAINKQKNPTKMLIVVGFKYWEY